MKRMLVSAIAVAAIAGGLGGCAGDSRCIGAESELENDVAIATELVLSGCLEVLQFDGLPSMETLPQDRLKLESCVAKEMQKIVFRAQDRVRSRSVPSDELGQIIFEDAIKFATDNKGYRGLSFDYEPTRFTGSNGKCEIEDRSFFQRRYG